LKYKNKKVRFDRLHSPCHDPFFDPSRPSLVRDPYFGNRWIRTIGRKRSVRQGQQS